jgi:hypothetical protein
MPKNLQKFGDFWDTTLEPLCEKSIHSGTLLWASMCNATTDEDIDAIGDAMTQVDRVDWPAVDFVAQTIVAVNVDLIEERNPKKRLDTVYKVFSSDNYYETFFKGTDTCEEASVYKELAECLKYGLTLL